MIDRGHLFINLDIFNPNSNEYASPYVPFVQDASEGALEGLSVLVTRITTKLYESGTISSQSALDP